MRLYPVQLARVQQSRGAAPEPAPDSCQSALRVPRRCRLRRRPSGCTLFSPANRGAVGRQQSRRHPWQETVTLAPGGEARWTRAVQRRGKSVCVQSACVDGANGPERCGVEARRSAAQLAHSTQPTPSRQARHRPHAQTSVENRPRRPRKKAEGDAGPLSASAQEQSRGGLRRARTNPQAHGPGSIDCWPSHDAPHDHLPRPL